ncbi:MAG: hypothetical protein H0V61_05805 [Chitinophagales bacterium]|jgi:uncharacterized coiled-coil DUF342 family protein|nr:hypothetical protein [Chitinophagales bacterium]
MNELIKQADELIGKINRLLDRNDKLSADLLERDERIRALQEEIRGKSDRLRLLQEEMNSVKLAGSIHVGEMDVKEFKRKLNEYLREIDRCILKLSAEG